jgi:hypothetical protein
VLVRSAAANAAGDVRGQANVPWPGQDAKADGIALETGMTCVRGHLSPRTAAADEAVGQRLRVMRAVDVLEQVLRRSGLHAAAGPVT